METNCFIFQLFIPPNITFHMIAKPLTYYGHFNKNLYSVLCVLQKFNPFCNERCLIILTNGYFWRRCVSKIDFNYLWCAVLKQFTHFQPSNIGFNYML